MNGTYRGSCHCGAIRYAVAIAIPTPTAPWTSDQRFAWTYKCNCTYCYKTHFWKAFVRASAFELLAGTPIDYRFGEALIQHHACARCAVTLYASADFEQMGGAFHAINLHTLDTASPAELAALPIRFEDGAHDAWDTVPAATAHL